MITDLDHHSREVHIVNRNLAAMLVHPQAAMLVQPFANTLGAGSLFQLQGSQVSVTTTDNISRRCPAMLVHQLVAILVNPSVAGSSVQFQISQ